MYGLIFVLLSVVLSSASPLAVPSVAQLNENNRKHGEKIPIPAGHHNQHQQQPSVSHIPPSQNGRRRIDAASSMDLVRYWPGTQPDLYNITLSAMKQYIKNQLNMTGLGGGPRKRSHHYSDADLDFYKKIQEFNNTQSTIGSKSVAQSNNKSSVLSVAHSPDASRPDMTMDLSELSEHDLQIEDPMASFEHPVDHSNDLAAAGATAGRKEIGSTPHAKDFNVLMDDPRGYIPAVPSNSHRPAKTTTWDSAFVRHKGEVLTFIILG
ncbi:uncharacterized protein LOC134209377 [Armigeres subalbatus]|uniref:uncharacterized protein LOC134209377 n=1 Tax=Armigeres subalbatus TaxID=124917 RepID=UPI002ED6A214